ncbi:MAG: class I SAM-dependent methyltransferase [Anaerolineae bacterium]|jgi:2-polyprenyl-3-methyl-5-hydroxy-6-metoxy-1,4-benzoquinol methylase
MEYVRCNLCGADNTVVRYPCTIEERPDGDHPSDWSAYACTHSGYGRHHTIVQCRECGLVYTNPRLDSHDIVDTYEAVEDPLYLEEREGRVLTFERHLKPLERVAGAPDSCSLLDVGCYTGVFVEIAARHGWDAWGLEPSRWAVEQAQARGLRVVQGTLDTADLTEAQFDVVTMWDVIEHLTDPREALKQAHRLLRDPDPAEGKSGGLVVVHTINIDSLFARLMGGRWPWLMEMHVYYFSRHTLRVMLEKCGFEVVSAKPQGRYLRLGYLMNRVGALVPFVGRPAERIVTRLRLRKVTVPIDLGDLFTVYARKV